MMGARPSVALLPPIIVGMRLLALSLFLERSSTEIYEISEAQT